MQTTPYTTTERTRLATPPEPLEARHLSPEVDAASRAADMDDTMLADHEAVLC